MRQFAFMLGLALLLSSPAVATGVSAKPALKDQGATVEFVTLNTHVLIQDGVIRLGDIFQGSGAFTDRVVAYGPRPGSRAVFDARWLRRVAVAFKMTWRPSSDAERVIVERESQVISRTEVENLLLERLIDDGEDSTSRAVLANSSFRLDLPVGEDYMLSVDQISFDPSTRRFSATLAWGNGKNERRRVTGKLEQMIEVPVLSKRMMGGDLIRQADLNWVEMPQARLARNAVTDASHLIGMAAKRTISAGKPISQNDVRRPKAISKGERVTMVLTTAAMRLTTKGTALEPGSVGDSIRISNSQTSTIVEGVITGPGQVRVSPAVNLAMR